MIYATTIGTIRWDGEVGGYVSDDVRTPSGPNNWRLLSTTVAFATPIYGAIVWTWEAADGHSGELRNET